MKCYSVGLIHQSQLFYEKFKCYMIALDKNTKYDLKIWKQDERRGGRKYSQLLHLVQVVMTYQVGILFTKDIVFCYKTFIYAFSLLILPFSECKGVVKKPCYINLFPI